MALLNRTAQQHDECRLAVAEVARPLVTCEAVIAESCHLLRHFPGAPEKVIANVEQGIFEIPVRLSESAGAVQRLMRKYRDLPASLADACLVHLADQVETGEILTLDHHFLAYRWRGNRPFELLIPLKG